jgi:hypothetical protein
MCPGPPVSWCSCPTQCARARLSAPLPHPRGAGRAAWPHHAARARQCRAAASRAPFTGQAGHPLHNSCPPSCHVAPPGAAPPSAPRRVAFPTSAPRRVAFPTTGERRPRPPFSTASSCPHPLLFLSLQDPVVTPLQLPDSVAASERQ